MCADVQKVHWSWGHPLDTIYYIFTTIAQQCCMIACAYIVDPRYARMMVWGNWGVRMAACDNFVHFVAVLWFGSADGNADGNGNASDGNPPANEGWRQRWRQQWRIGRQRANQWGLTATLTAMTVTRQPLRADGNADGNASATKGRNKTETEERKGRWERNP